MVALDMINTRMKDFYDIWFLLSTLDIDDTSLESAIRKTFSRRKTELPIDIPASLTAAFTKDQTKVKQWQAFLRKNRLSSDLTLHQAASVIRRRLLPLLKDEK